MFEFQLSVPLCFVFVLSVALCTYILISAVMEGMWLLDATIDSGHRDKVLVANPRKLKPLITRTPKENWRIHPRWVQRYWFYLFYRHMFSIYIIVLN